jgi:hypothetical protein
MYPDPGFDQSEHQVAEANKNSCFDTWTHPLHGAYLFLLFLMLHLPRHIQLHLFDEILISMCEVVSGLARLDSCLILQGALQRDQTQNLWSP